jgi:tRNA/rRNA methyltransferase
MEDAPLADLAVVLFEPRLAENVGSACRAMANMGCSELIVVSDREFDLGRAKALATPKGRVVLAGMRLLPSLPEALAPFQTVFGTTARTGGWRKGIVTPEAAAAQTAPALSPQARCAVVFGPEDKGLTNAEIQICGRLMTIPADRGATSLNLAQAVLIVLYEFFKARLAKPFKAAGPPDSRSATFEEREALFANLRQTLLAIDFLKDDNPDYWMLPVRRFVERVGLRRNEFNLLMGICRQVDWAMGRGRAKAGETRDGDATRI